MNALNNVYALAFRGDRFLMIFNPRRQGWEMPGGKIEDNEGTREAVRREFVEETGLEFIPIISRKIDDAIVFAGTIGKRVGKGEMESRFFSRLPDKLSFAQCEYEEQLTWAKQELSARRKSNC